MPLKIFCFLVLAVISGCFYQITIERSFDCNSLNENYKISVYSIGLRSVPGENKYVSQDMYTVKVHLKNKNNKPIYCDVHTKIEKYSGEAFLETSYSEYREYAAYLLADSNNKFLEIDLSNNIKVGDKMNIKILMKNGDKLEWECKLDEKKSYFSFPTA